MNTLPLFDGPHIRPQDQERLSTALSRVYNLMKDGRWRTLEEIARLAQTSQAGASARLRDLRKDKFRVHYPNIAVHSQRWRNGLWVYKLEV